MAFGQLLKEARERKGWDLNQTARRLRIRPDILRSIENSDFENMPPRGYTRNMVNAYARQVGLNPTEITRMYLDEYHDFQTRGQSGAYDSRYRRDAGYQRGARDARETSQRSSRTDRDYRRTGSERASSSGRTERTRSSRTESFDRTSSYRSSVSSRREEDREPAPRYVNRSNMEYTNFYSGSSQQASQSNLLIYIMAVVVVIAIILAVLLFVSCSSNNDSDDDSTVTTVPITGMTDTTVTDDSSDDEDDAASDDEEDSDSDDDETSVETVTSVEFVYEVLDGTSAYIEIYLDGSSSASVATTIDGYYSASITLTSEMDFKTTSPSNVVAYVDGVEVELEDIYGAGVYHYIFDIDEYNEELASSSEEQEDDSDE